MENKPEKASGKSNLLTIVLSLLLVVSLVFNVVLYLDKDSLNQQIDTLTVENQNMLSDLDTMTQSALQSEADLTEASQTIEQLTASAAEADQSITALQSEFAAYQTEAQATQETLTAAIQQGEADIKAAQEEGAKALADLQAIFDAYKAESEATIASLSQPTEPDATPEPVEETTTEPVAENSAAEASAFAPDPDAVVATINGQDVTGALVLDSYDDLVNYYGEPTPETVEYYYAYAMDQAITLVLIQQTAAELGLDQFTQEETDAMYAESDSSWEAALDSYVAQAFTLTEESTDAEKADAYAEAEAYYGDMGYTQESLRDSFVENTLYDRVMEAVCADVTVTDAEVDAVYQEAIAADQALYASDANAYENQIMMYQYGYADALPWYHPEGYRYIKHILLPVDSDLMTAYTDLATKYEAQQGAADTDTAEAEEPEEPVTAEQVAEAKAAAIASVQLEIDEIQQALAEGTLFEDLIAQYGTDPGMVSDDNPDGYEVSADSISFVPEFVNAAFSVDAIGDVSEPYLSDYGVHIAKYMGDVPGGPIELTEDKAEMIRTDLENTKNNEVLNTWHDSADIQYTGVLRSIDEIEASEAE